MSTPRSTPSSRAEALYRRTFDGRSRDWSGLAAKLVTGVQGAVWLWPYGGLAAVLSVVMLPAWTTSDVLIIGGDALLIHYPWFVLWRDALASGEFPFWNPYTFSGLPAFPTLQAGYGYPPHWALTWLPALSAMNWTIGLHVLLAGLGAAWCAGRLGASRDGQFLAGVAYALGSAMTARMWSGHLSFLESNAWLPIATGLAVDIRRTEAPVYLALAVALMTLAGQPEVLIFSLWWLPLWAVLAGGDGHPRAVIRALLRTCLGVGLGVGLAAFQLLPVLELLAVSNRQAGMSWDFQTGASLPPWHVLEVLAPLLFGDPRQSYWPGPGYEWHERILFVGIVPLLAASLAPGRWRWICWGCAGIGVALAFGRYLPGYAWTQVLPGYQDFRIPSKHLVLAALALSLAAGLGARRLYGPGVAFMASAGAVLIGLAAYWFADWFPGVALLLGGAERLSVPVVRESASTLAASALQPASVVLMLVAIMALLPAAWARRGMLLLAALELALVLQPFRLARADPETIISQAGALREYPRAVFVGDGGALVGNFGPVLRVAQPVGYVSLISQGYMALLTGTANAGVAMDVARGDDPSLRLLGYGVIVDRDRGTVTVVEPPPPQVWVARCAWPGGALEVRAPDFPRSACVALPTVTARDDVIPPGPARIIAERAGWLQVTAQGPGWLVTTQPWYPGWSARLNGGPTSVEVVDGALVGVPLPPGEHTVIVEYRPAGLTLGLSVSAVAGLVLVLFLRWDRRKPAPKTSR